MTAYNREEMTKRFAELQAECARIEAGMVPLEQVYSEWRNGPVRDLVKERAAGVALKAARIPLREVRREMALLARALGTVLLVAEGAR